MKKYIFAFFFIAVCFSLDIIGQIPTNVLIRIVKAEDELRFDKTLEDLLKNPNAKIRARAALAAGRIGNDAAIPALISLLEKDKDAEVRALAAFSLGEIESIKATDAVLRVLENRKEGGEIRAKAVEAAGKIAAANAGNDKAKELGEAILDALEFEAGRRSAPHQETILKGLTAVLRARPEEGNIVAAKFLTYRNARIRADAANTLARLRAKNANDALRSVLMTDDDAVARANAARALGAAEDKASLNALLEAAVTDDDSRVRVSAIRAIGNLKDKASAEKLIERGNFLFSGIRQNPSKKSARSPAEKSELLEIATILGRLLPNTSDQKAVAFLNNLRRIDNYLSPETEIAFARVAPKNFVEFFTQSAELLYTEDWRTASAVFQGLGEIAALEAGEETNALKSQTRVLLVQLLSIWLTHEQKSNQMRLAIPDLIRAFAAFKSENTSGILRPFLDVEKDLFVRATIAEVLADQPPSKENIDALNKAFTDAILRDKDYNDAQLAILDALAKTGKKESVGTFLKAVNAPDYLVRKKAFEILREKDFELLREDSAYNSNIKKYIEYVQKKNRVFPYNSRSGTKLGQILNTTADYTRAVSRRNGTVRAVLTTEKGAFTIDLAPENAPLTVDNFIKLARAGYFNNVAVHRVVPNFVMQDGDPRGDGNGGPGYSIRCEINLLEYERGAVGMALSGKDTGGSQWFVTHAPQPHLDGGYTVFGKVNETDMKIVDSITRGDKILSVKIFEEKAKRKPAR